MKSAKWLRRWQMLGLLSIVALMAMVIVACGGDEETPAATAAPTAAPAPTQAPQPTPQPTAAPATAAPATAAPRPTAAPATAAPATAAPATAAPTQERIRIPQATAMPTAAPTVAAPQEPVQPRLRVSMSPPGVQATTHWKLAGWQSAQGPLYTMYDTLIHLDRYDESYVPYLAESWEIGAGATEWTFKLKEGIPFYRNKQPTEYTMTVEDVIHSFEINFFPPYQAGIPGLAAQSTPDPRHFDIKSDYEFVWKLDKPDLTWGYWSSDDRRGVASKAYWDDVGEEGYIADPIGNGPFTFSWFELNQGLIVERVEDHYRQTPMFHEVQFFYVIEEATRMAMLFTKEADIVSIARSLHGQATAEGFRVVNSTTPSSYTFMFIGGMFSATRPDGYSKCPPGDEIKPDENQMCPAGRYEIDEESPMRNVLVREALNLAIDRDQMNDVFFDGTALKTTHWAFPPWWTHGDPSWAPYDFDPDRARQLITEAGYPNGFEMDVYVPPPITGLPEIGEMAEVVAQYFESVGLEVTLKPINTAQQSSIPRNREHSRGVIQTRFGPPGRGQLVRHFKNNVNWRQEWQQHDEIYDFVNRLEAASSWPELDAIEIEAANWARDNHLMIPLYWLVGQVVVNPDIVASYESRHLHMGPSRHHEYTVPVYK